MESDAKGWDVGAILEKYGEDLLRAVADRLLKPRSTWPVDDLRQKCVEGLQNPILIDRRLKELPHEARKVLRFAQLSGQPVWRVDHLLQALAALDHIDGARPVLALLESGLAFPELPETLYHLRNFEDWLGADGLMLSRIWIPPSVSARATEVALGFPALPAISPGDHPGMTGDGWEWPIRIACAWQKLDGTNVKVAQTGTYYKRELAKLQTDSVLNAPFALPLGDLPEPGVLAFTWARSLGLFRRDKTDIAAQNFGELWTRDAAAFLKECLAAFFRIADWNPLEGYAPESDRIAAPSIALVALLCIAEAPADQAVSLDAIAEFIGAKHPDGRAGGRLSELLRGLALGIFAQLRLVDIFTRPDGDYVRLAELGRWILKDGKKPELEARHAQTLTVQPNGEIILFRQHLRVPLIADLTRFAVWRTIGPACTLEIDPDRMYRGLESGLTFSQIVQTLDKFGMYPLPATVRDSINRWSSKRDRVTVHASATLIEFSKPEELEEAYRRGLVAEKLTDRIGISDRAEIDFKHFRLLGNRDYESPPQPCIEFLEDGLTFDVLAAKSDLLLEAELKQVAEPLPVAGSFERRRYRLTQERLRKMAEAGWSRELLDRWCRERTGGEASPAAKLLFQPPQNLELRAEEKLVLQLPNEALADGLLQWPATAALIEMRLGPTAVAVGREHVEQLRERLRSLGIGLE